MRDLKCLFIALAFLATLSNAIAEATSTGRLPDGLEPPVGSRGGRSPAAIGGVPSKDHKIVGIVFDAYGEKDRVCSGLYISSRYILTAAHCTCDATNIRVTNADYARDAFLLAEIASVFDGYNCSRGYIPRGDDLALLRIPTELRDGSEQGDKTCTGYTLLPKIQLAARWFPLPPENVSAAGYGFNGESVGGREEVVVTLNSALCTSRIAKSMTCQPFKEFVGGNLPRRGIARDTCGGDSGGPAFFRNGSEFIPFGIVSRALPVRHPYTERECGAGGIYTHLGRTDVLAWLTSNNIPEVQTACPPELPLR